MGEIRIVTTRKLQDWIKTRRHVWTIWTKLSPTKTGCNHKAKQFLQWFLSCLKRYMTKLVSFYYFLYLPKSITESDTNSHIYLIYIKCYMILLSICPSIICVWIGSSKLTNIQHMKWIGFCVFFSIGMAQWHLISLLAKINNIVFLLICHIYEIFTSFQYLNIRQKHVSLVVVQYTNFYCEDVRNNYSTSHRNDFRCNLIGNLHKRRINIYNITKWKINLIVGTLFHTFLHFISVDIIELFTNCSPRFVDLFLYKYENDCYREKRLN